MNAFLLKLIACITMLIDHIGSELYPYEEWYRIVGRLAFPIYCFLLVEGFNHTKNIRRYLMRLFFFALLSEVPFDLYFYDSCFYIEKQNVFFTLFFGLFLLELLRKEVDPFIKITAIIAVCFIAEELHFDYRYPGILMILCFEWFRKWRIFRFMTINSIQFRLFKSYIQDYASLALLPISLYNGKRGPSLKYFFYLYYPGHLLMLYAIKMMYFRNAWL